MILKFFKNNFKKINKYSEINFGAYKDELKALRTENKIKHFKNMNKQSNVEDKSKYNLKENNIKYKNILIKNYNIEKKGNKKKFFPNIYLGNVIQNDDLSNKPKESNKKDNLYYNNSENIKNDNLIKQIMKKLKNNISSDINYVSNINNNYKIFETFREFSADKSINRLEDKSYDKYREIKLEKYDNPIKNRSTNSFKFQNSIFYIPLNQRSNNKSFNFL